MTNSELSGRTAIVTGASSGIGRAIARSLAAAGATVYLTGRSADRLEEAAVQVREAGGTAVAVPGDVRDLAQLDAVIDRAVAETGTLNIFVNNAGLSVGDYPILDGHPEDWREMLEVNVLALARGSQAAVRAMRSGGFPGHIVNVGSIAPKDPANGVYGATKAAVAYINQELRRELVDDPIRVVQITPGTVLSNFARQMPPERLRGLFSGLGVDADLTEENLLSPDFIDRPHPDLAKVFLVPDDIARAVLYAVSQPTTVDVFEIDLRPQADL